MQYLQPPPFQNSFYDDRMRFEIDSSLIFVFGSNLSGRHGAGAAKEALMVHGAIYGQAEGHQGFSYAIPTKDRHLKPLSLEEINVYVQRFLTWNANNPDKPLYITAVGTGFSEYPHAAIAPMFKGIKNAWLPEPWRKFILE